MTGYVLLAIASAALLAAAIFLVRRIVRIWQDASRRGFSAPQRIAQAMAGALVPAHYWWKARIDAMPLQARHKLLEYETGRLGVSHADSQICPLCGAEILDAWTLDASGQPDVASGPILCSACDFRLDACRHCEHFLPGPPLGWSQFAFGERDITYGRCSLYKKVQPVEQAAAPDVARQLKSRGYDQISAPMPIQDSMMRPDSCHAFKPSRKRLKAGGVRWPDARRTALLTLLEPASGPRGSDQGSVSRGQVE